MTGVGRGFDLLVGLIGVAAWGLAAYVFGSRLISPTAGGLLAVGLFLTGLSVVIGGEVQEGRMRRLAAGICPRCSRPVESEHRHRRWDAGRAVWQPPSLTWECRACGFSQGEEWACPSCPPPD